MNNKGAIGIKVIILIVLSLVVVVFLLQNFQVVEIHFLAWKWSMSRVILVLFSMAIGLVAGLILGWEFFRKKEKKEGESQFGS